MNGKNTMAFLGLGNRGYIYAGLAQKTGDVNITAICDENANTLAKVGDSLGIPENMRFLSTEEFFAAGKKAEVLVISTPDAAHHRNCIDALRAGYDVVLEKPIASSKPECDEILETAEKLKRRVVVCHVLRYTDFYNKIKQIILSGNIGKVMHVSQSENVGWWHYTQSFVRGKWKSEKTSSPMILAKCCHDLDIINWLIDDKCVSLSSYGSLDFFAPENAPAGSGENCIDCKLRGECLYDAVGCSKEMRGSMIVPYGFGYTDEEIDAYFADRSNPFGKCVFKSGNDVVDHQTVAMRYAGGATATLNMHAFAQATYRHTKISGTKGEIDAIFGEVEPTYINVKIFDRADKYKVERYDVLQGDSGHGGGDGGFVNSVIDYFFRGKQNPDITSLEASMASHYMAFAAEESRLGGGENKKL